MIARAQWYKALPASTWSTIHVTTIFYGYHECLRGSYLCNLVWATAEKISFVSLFIALENLKKNQTCLWWKCVTNLSVSHKYTIISDVDGNLDVGQDDVVVREAGCGGLDRHSVVSCWLGQTGHGTHDLREWERETARRGRGVGGGGGDRDKDERNRVNVEFLQKGKNLCRF